MAETKPKAKLKASKEWMRLDNAAKIYPAIRSAKYSSVFRISVTLKEKIDPRLLQRALEDTVRRIPIYAMRLRPGLFWYYLEQNHGVPTIEEDVANPCKPIHTKENGGFQFRVRYYHCRIALELFHVLADGSGAMAFLKTLTARYLELKGHKVTHLEDVLDTRDELRDEEVEDSFTKYARTGTRSPRKESRAYHIMGTKLPVPQLNVITGILPVEAVLQTAKKYKATLTEFLTANYILALLTVQRAEQRPLKYSRPVKVSVPVNLRSFYPSKTLRNFSQYINPGVDPYYGDYTLEEIIDQVHCFMRMRLNDKYLNAQIGANVADELNPIVRAVPLFIKNVALSLAFHLVGETRFTATFSNLGMVRLPDDMAAHVQRFDFLLGPGKVNYSNCAAASFGGKLYLNFSRTIKEAFVEQQFFTQLVRMGIPVKVESNNA